MSVAFLKKECPFCSSNAALKEQIIAESNNGFLIASQSSPGNYLIIPSQHTEALVDLPDTWWRDIKELLTQVPGLPTTYNLSINIGHTAGQRVAHLHFWVIPRKDGQPSSHKGMASLINEVNQTAS